MFCWMFFVGTWKGCDWHHTSSSSESDRHVLWGRTSPDLEAVNTATPVCVSTDSRVDYGGDMLLSAWPVCINGRLWHTMLSERMSVLNVAENHFVSVNVFFIIEIFTCNYVINSDVLKTLKFWKCLCGIVFVSFRKALFFSFILWEYCAYIH